MQPFGPFPKRRKSCVPMARSPPQTWMASGKWSVSSPVHSADARSAHSTCSAAAANRRRAGPRPVVPVAGSWMGFSADARIQTRSHRGPLRSLRTPVRRRCLKQSTGMASLTTKLNRREAADRHPRRSVTRRPAELGPLDLDPRRQSRVPTGQHDRPPLQACRVRPTALACFAPTAAAR